MTPKKNVIFSRVRTTLVDCQEAVSVVRRWETWARDKGQWPHKHDATAYLKLEFTQLAVEVVGEHLS